MEEEEVDIYDDELQHLCSEITQGIDELDTIPNKPQQRIKAHYLEGRIKRAKTVLKSYRIELRDLEATVAEPFHHRAKEYEEIIDEFTRDLGWKSKQFQDERGELFAGEPTLIPVDEMNSVELLELGARIQGKSMTSLDRSLQTIDSDQKASAAAAANLKVHSEQFQNTKNDLEDVEANLKDSGKLLRSLTRRILTDKAIMILIFLIMAGVVFILVFKVIRPNVKPITDRFVPRSN